MKKNLLLFLLSLSGCSAFSQNNYLDFDGINDNVTVTSSANLLSGSSAISMSCNVYPKNTSPSFPAFDGFSGYRNDSNFDFYLIQLSSTHVEARFRNSSGTTYTLTYSGLVLNQWNHFFMVYNGSTLKLYKGTLEVASIPASGSVPTSNSSVFRIGNIQYSAFNFYHKGYIDEVSLWNKALSATEITAIMDNNGEIADSDGEADLKLYYKFNQGTAYGSNAGLTNLVDEMGWFDGTLINFALTGNTSNWGGQIDLAANVFKKQQTTAYPNPVSNTLNFTSGAEINEIKIIDIEGRTILHQKEITSLSTSINVSALKNGVYFALINGNQNIKFIKN